MNINFGDLLIYVTCFFGLFTSFYFLILLFENRHDLKDKKLRKNPFVTIIVPAYNEQKTLEKTIGSLLALKYPKEKYEILIIDDGSTDRTWEIAKRLEKSNNIIKAYHQKNAGKGSALNFALKKAKGEFVGALDADSFVDPDALNAILSRFDDPKTMAVTPSMKIYRANKFLEVIQEVEYVLGIFLRKIFAFVGSIHVTPGPFSIFRKQFFDKYGGYDEHNLTEDIEIALRIQSKGYHIENTLHAHVYTTPPKSFFALLKQRLRWYYGFITNVEKYKHLFHPKTGNLGIIIMPAAFISVFLVMISFGYTMFKFVEWLINTLKIMVILGWDYFRLMNFEIDLFTMFNNKTLLSFITIMMSIILIFIANRMSNKNKYMGIRFVIFSLFYWFFFGFWWIMAFAYRLTGKKIRWGHRSL
jgi:cellulose synthase/poly-beta-1,6-N-acetylglucosamine synthase-like glycosyltransferase